MSLYITYELSETEDRRARWFVLECILGKPIVINIYLTGDKSIEYYCLHNILNVK